MAIKNYKGNSCKNARINIDYSKKKPVVQFSYPSKKHGTEGSMLPFIYFFWFFIWFFFMVSSSLYDIGLTLEDNNSTTNITNATTVDGIYYNISTYQGCVGFLDTRKINEKVCNRTTSSNYTSPTIPQQITTSINEDLEEMKDNFTFDFIFRLLLLILPPLIIYYPFKKSWQNVFPKFMAGGRKKFTIFNAKDIRYTKELGYYCELPVFKNVVLNYEATKEFSKYMKCIDIREHNFRYWREKPKRKLTKRQKSRRRGSMLNDYIWYARFFFTKKPSIGKLEVLYR